MQEKHLIKKGHTFMACQYKNHETIYKLKKQALNKLATTKGRHFFVISRKIDTGLPALVVALFRDGSKCSDANRMPCKISWITFSGVEVLF